MSSVSSSITTALKTWQSILSETINLLKNSHFLFIGECLAAEYLFTHFNHFLGKCGEDLPKSAIYGKIKIDLVGLLFDSVRFSSTYTVFILCNSSIQLKTSVCYIYIHKKNNIFTLCRYHMNIMYKTVKWPISKNKLH